MVDKIVSAFNPERIIVFGSHARGTAGPDSDVDFLIVMPVSGSKRRLTTQIDLAVSDRTVPIDLIVVTPEEFEKSKDLVGTIVRPAVREGVVLHERAG